MDDVKISKFMSLVLRHDPSALGVTLDANGWTDFSDFAARMIQKFGVTEEELRNVISTNSKQRFALRDGLIRANQGHSASVDLALSPRVPPEVLFHGTTREAAKSIMVQGLTKQERMHVHLSADVATAEQVAKRRRGPWIIYSVDAHAMNGVGMTFYLSDNGVWLVDAVASQYLTVFQEWGTA